MPANISDPDGLDALVRTTVATPALHVSRTAILMSKQKNMSQPIFKIKEVVAFPFFLFLTQSLLIFNLLGAVKSLCPLPATTFALQKISGGSGVEISHSPSVHAPCRHQLDSPHQTRSRLFEMRWGDGGAGLAAGGTESESIYHSVSKGSGCL